MHKKLIAYLVVVLAAFGMTAAHAEGQVELKVPFVGCPSYGPKGPVPAPSGATKTMTVSFKLPGPVAFYKGRDGAGIFAPAGWHCYGLSAVDSKAIIVSTHELPTSGIPPEPLDAPVIELSSVDGKYADRLTVARYASMLFPDISKDFVGKVEAQGIWPRSDIEVPASPTDSIRRLNPELVAFETPAEMKGLGTGRLVKVGPTPVSGLAALNDRGHFMAVSILRMSLGDQADVWSRVLVMFNTPCVTANPVCGSDAAK